MHSTTILKFLYTPIFQSVESWYVANTLMASVIELIKLLSQMQLDSVCRLYLARISAPNAEFREASILS